jgi:single-stranded-DNA-specific exonuclease
MRWIYPEVNPGGIAEFAAQLGVTAVTSRLLIQRGYSDLSVADQFLNPSLSNLSDPLRLGGMLSAVQRLEEALRRQESVLIFGDYDVDGVTSTTLLTHFLRQFGLNPRFIVPRRLEEGYGLSMESLERAISVEKPDLLIAVDCGTSSTAEVAWLRKNGISVIILDHHAAKEDLPQDCDLVNPHVHDPDDAPWKHLCSVGLVFKFCHAVLKFLRQQSDPLAEKLDLRQYLDLVALGTVSDLVSLTGENRILVRRGLRALQACKRPGICALMDVANIQLGQALSAADIGFKLGPRINASGRLDDAALPIELLLGEDWQSCRDKAMLLDAHNAERKDIERWISREAEAMVLKDFADDAGLVVYAPHWHTGVVGIVASRLSRQFHRPALVIGADEELCKGSGRSIPGVNLVEILSESADCLERWGGHPMAIGLSIQSDQINDFRKAFNRSISGRFPDGLPERTLSIDAVLQASELSSELLNELDALGPFGQGMPEPIFALRNIRIERPQFMKNNHFKFSLINPKTGHSTEAVAWGLKDKPDVRRPADIAFRFHRDTWRGESKPRLTLIDWQQQ